MKSKVYELLDFPRHARPSIDEIRVADTAASLLDRLSTESFMSYNSVWPKLIDVVRHGASEEYLRLTFSFYKHEWKNKSLQSAVRELSAIVGRKGVWYRLRREERSVAGFVFKNSIRGVWFFEDKAYAVLINARKSQRLSKSDVAFLARGIYELYCIDDPNDPIPMIVDLSADPNLSSQKRGPLERKPACYIVASEEMMSLDSFEEVARVFLEAMATAGISTPAAADRHVIDLLRGRFR